MTEAKRKAKTRVSDIHLDEISLVGKGDNPPAKTLLAKQRLDAAGAYQKLATALAAALGKVSPALSKMLYSEVMERQARDCAYSALQNRIGALSEAVYSSLYFPEEQGRAQSDIAASVIEFSDAVSDELADILAGKIVKQFGGREAPPVVEEFRKEFGKWFDDEVPDLEESPGDVEPGSTDGGIDMKTKIDLSKPLSKEDRELVEKGLAALENAETFEERLAALEKGREDDPPQKAAAEPTEADLLKAMPEEHQALFKAQEARWSQKYGTLEKAFDSLLADQRVEALAKSVDFRFLPAKPAEIAKQLIEVPEGPREFVVKILKAANEAVGKAGDILAAIGDDPDPEAKDASAYAQLEAGARELMKSDPKLTAEAAFAKFCEMNPELYKRHRIETQPRPH